MLARPAAAEVAHHQPVTGAGLRDQDFFVDAEPIVQAIGERQRRANPLGKRGRVRWNGDDDDFGARQRLAHRNRGEHAERAVAGDDDPSGKFARLAHGPSASRRALPVRNSR